MQNYKNLSVWDKSHRLVLNLYKLTEKFPKSELFGLTSQLRRASISVPANIAEGCGRCSRRELSRFFYISMGSACELEYLLLLSYELDYISKLKIDEMLFGVEEVKKMLTSFIKKVNFK